MKRLGLCVLLLCACDEKASTPQASRSVDPVTPSAPVAPVDAMPPAVRDLELVLPPDAAADANVEIRPDEEKPKAKQKASKAVVLALPGEEGGDPVHGADAGPVDKGIPAPREPYARIKFDSKRALDETSLTDELVKNKTFTTYMAGLKRCYKQTLRVNPVVAGKLTLTFTVGPEGRVTEPNAAGPDAALDTCVEGLMTRWTFPAPKNIDGEPASARFELALQLTPE